MCYITEINNGEPPRPEGIQINSIAPLIDTFDIYENPINLKDLLQSYNGVLIDFFRGNW
ncbi:MAG: hypothetical protein ACFFCM_09660 [Promethearchaeota archaeon]